MADINRGRVTVAFNNTWRLYTQSVEGCKMLGTIQRKMEIAALAQIDNGEYVAVNKGLIEPLNSRKVQAAIDQLKLATHLDQSHS
jgi:hypothetical protein